MHDSRDQTKQTYLEKNTLQHQHNDTMHLYRRATRIFLKKGFNQK